MNLEAKNCSIAALEHQLSESKKEYSLLSEQDRKSPSGKARLQALVDRYSDLYHIEKLITSTRPTRDYK